MEETIFSDYSDYDHPQVLAFLFHPRPEIESDTSPSNAEDLLIPVDNDIMISGKFFSSVI